MLNSLVRHTQECAEHEARPPADSGHPHRRGEGGGCSAQEHRCDGYRGQFGPRRDMATRQSPHGHNHDRRGLK
jgi:hypothetical protein